MLCFENYVIRLKPEGCDLDCEVATSMIAQHKKPRHDLIVVLHSKSCDAAKKVVARLLKTRDHRGGDSTVRNRLVRAAGCDLLAAVF